MEESVQLKTFTVAQLRSWLYDNAEAEGLSDALIARTRAFAIVNNPFAEEDMIVISAIFVNGEVGAYTYAFPDKLRRPDKTIFWNTTLYVNPKYEGRGYAYCVMGQMYELYGDSYFDLDAVEASVENFSYLGMKTDYVRQYVLSDKALSSDLKGRIAGCLESVVLHFRHKKVEKALESKEYQLVYVDFIDAATYAFIESHSQQDLFLRRREMLNWILKYPFFRESPLASRVPFDTVFTSTCPLFRIYGVKVLSGSLLVGFYMLRLSRDGLYVQYLYCESGYEELVYSSLAAHSLKFPNRCFVTADEHLAAFMENSRVYTKSTVIGRSFTHPASFEYDGQPVIQAGDGDNIT